MKRLLLALALSITCACASFQPSALGMVTAMDMVDQHLESTKVIADPVPGDTHKAYLPKMKAFAERLGVIVAFGELDPGLWGFYSRPQLFIGINDTLPANTQVAALAHELGHVFQPEELNGLMQGDVFAEAVAYRYCQEIGLSTRNATFDYLRIEPELSRKVILTYHREIDEIVVIFEEEIQ